MIDKPAYTRARGDARTVLTMLERRNRSARFLFRCCCGEGAVVQPEGGEKYCTNCGDQWA